MRAAHSGQTHSLEQRISPRNRAGPLLALAMSTFADIRVCPHLKRRGSFVTDRAMRCNAEISRRCCRAESESSPCPLSWTVKLCLCSVTRPPLTRGNASSPASRAAARRASRRSARLGASPKSARYDASAFPPRIDSAARSSAREPAGLPQGAFASRARPRASASANAARAACSDSHVRARQPPSRSAPAPGFGAAGASLPSGAARFARSSRRATAVGQVESSEDSRSQWRRKSAGTSSSSCAGSVLVGAGASLSGVHGSNNGPASDRRRIVASSVASCARALTSARGAGNKSAADASPSRARALRGSSANTARAPGRDHCLTRRSPRTLGTAADSAASGMARARAHPIAHTRGR